MKSDTSLSQTEKRCVTIIAIIGITMVVISANLSPSPKWLLFTGWILLGACIAIRINNLPEKSPYKLASYGMAIPLFFSTEYWVSPFLKLVFRPSDESFRQLFTGKPFLVLVIIYLAIACLFHRINEKQRQ
ncbi:MAG: hypothetical protein JNK38_14550 [Acidobacteria bacterium]|nr:hypothetical protein [Acidobacteriota bacterium]